MIFIQKIHALNLRLSKLKTFANDAQKVKVENLWHWNLTKCERSPPQFIRRMNRTQQRDCFQNRVFNVAISHVKNKFETLIKIIENSC